MALFEEPLVAKELSMCGKQPSTSEKKLSVKPEKGTSKSIRDNVNKKPSSPVYVKSSPIHGKGLFAARLIQKDEVIGCFRCRPVNSDGPHVLWIDEQGYLVEDEFKFINHSQNANACYYDDFTVVALANIAQDEEICHNYGDDWAEQ